jgi:hypothetical protein
VKEAVLLQWDTQQAQKVAKSGAARVQKISNILRKGQTPSFQAQTAPPSGSMSSGSKKKGKCSTHGKGKGKGKAPYGKVHFVSTASTIPNSTHTIAAIMLQGLQHCIAIEDPETSSFGNGLWTSFNQAPAPSSGCNSYGYTPEEVEAISPCLLLEGHPKRKDAEKVPVFFGPGSNLPHMPIDHWEITSEMSTADRGNTPASDDEFLFRKWDLNDQGTSGWDDLFVGDDGYTSFDLISYTATNSPAACRWTTPSLFFFF